MDSLVSMLGTLGVIVIAQIVVCVVIVMILRKVLLGDTMNAIARIRAVEAEVGKKEDQIRQRIEAHEKEFEEQKARSEAELQRRREIAEQEVGAERERMLTEAKAEGEKLLAEAHRNKEKLRNELIRETTGTAVDCAAQAFELVFSERMTEAVNRVFVDELLDAIGEVDGASITVDGDGAEFAASHPLAAESKQRLQALLKEKFDVDIAVNETVDPSLIAGLKMKLGSLEIDGTLLNHFREGFEQVKSEKGLV